MKAPKPTANTPTTTPAVIPPFTPPESPYFVEATAVVVGEPVEVAAALLVLEMEGKVVKPDAVAEAEEETEGAAVGCDPTLLRVQCIPGESRAASVGCNVSSTMSRYMSGPVN